jgi:hypothetical protein
MKTYDNIYLLSRTCAFCNVNLNSLTPYKKYCSNTCKQKFFRKNSKKLNFQINKTWKDNNKEYLKEQFRSYYKKNPSKYIAKTRKRQATKLHATLKGFDEEINKIYSECPKDFQVQ